MPEIKWNSPDQLMQYIVLENLCNPRIRDFPTDDMKISFAKKTAKDLKERNPAKATDLMTKITNGKASQSVTVIRNKGNIAFAMGVMIDGKKEGDWFEMTKNFDLAAGSYVDGKKEGKWASGRLAGSRDSLFFRKSLDASYKNGQPDGKWTWYNENGSLKMLGQYQKGVKVGKWVENNEGAISTTDYGQRNVSNTSSMAQRLGKSQGNRTTLREFSPAQSEADTSYVYRSQNSK